VLVLALMVAAGAFLTGPSTTAVRTRQRLTAAIGRLRGGAEEAGLRTGPVGTWVYANKQLLRIGAVTLAALALVFWGQPTGTVILLMPDQQPQPRPARLLGELEHGDVAVGVPSGQDRPPPDPTPDPHRLGGTVVQDVDLRPAHDPAATFARLIRQ
jgi:hypothetical protein